MTNESAPNAKTAAATHQEHGTAPQHSPISPRKALVGVALVLIAAVLLAIFGILPRQSAEAALKKHTTEMAPPTVIVASPQQGAPIDSLVLPGNVTSFTDAPIYARTSGYLTRWYYDIGAHVKKGALLAEISTPELDQQLLQAQADLATSQATASNAHTQAERYKGLVSDDAVSKQDTETFVNQAAATSAAVRSAQANVQRLKELQSFEKIYAPFDGVVTARSVDIGQLIDTGVGNELFHMQAIQTLRVYANLPQIYSQSARRGAKIGLTFVEHPGKTFEGTLVRTADAIDPSNRTLLVEVDVNNKAGDLLPGSLAQVHFKTPAVAPTFVIPVAALIFRHEGLRVGTLVNGNKAHLAPVTIGQDDGATVQIVSGLGPNDQVIQDPPDSLIEGEQVYVNSSPAGPANVGGK
jgi:RND family efflux transporter MFP subunit